LFVSILELEMKPFLVCHIDVELIAYQKLYSIYDLILGIRTEMIMLDFLAKIAIPNLICKTVFLPNISSVYI